MKNAPEVLILLRCKRCGYVAIKPAKPTGLPCISCLSHAGHERYVYVRT